MSQYKIACLNFFEHLQTHFRFDSTVQNREIFIPDQPRDYEFKNNSKARRHQLYPKTSANRHPPEEISCRIRSTRPRSLGSQLRWYRSLWMQAGRGQSLQLQLSRCNLGSGISLESQPIKLQPQWSLSRWYRSGVVQSQRMYHSQGQYPENDPSSPVSFWKGDL